MGLIGFFGRRERIGRKLRQQKILVERAKRFESEDALSASIGRQKERIRSMKRKRFQRATAPAFAAIESIQKGAKKARKFSDNLPDLGFVQEDFSGGQPRKRGRRKGPRPMEWL